ncbi:geranylgeranyl transferase type-2 subunit alpha [Epargyreus clarus]|uniref:geranylgeranyl transferase type-2 subunit alpha n=1 Tax=Epargyreus clarus TaxID=520877 RepID=UPI003C2AE687
MHGRVKVRTTEEEKARREKEKQAKLKEFKNVWQQIRDKRKLRHLDKELLELTGNCLSSNPDILTLWNIRRETLIEFSKSGKSDEEMSKQYDDELRLTEYCLKRNPKSYGAWYQRQWVLLTRPDPDWKTELDLCQKYLKFDERNFHTWDYRRFVVSHYKAPLQEEFDFTTEKIHDNFSNYSAWHYRSKMLVELYPDLEGGRPIKDNYHKHELKMVQSAAFTDPDDTSAWFYLRWLLGAVKSNIHPVVFCVTPTKTTLAWSKYVSRELIQSTTKIYFNNELVEGEWIPCIGKDYDDLWIYNHQQNITDGMNIKVEYENDKNEKQIIACREYKPSLYVGKSEISFQNKYSQPVLLELKDQLDSCRQLLQLEPDNKWTLLTTTVILYCIDAKLYHKEILANLHSLKTIDKLRTGYYDDLISKWCLEEQLMINYCTSSLQLTMQHHEKIATLYHIQYYSFCEDVDLSNQKLTSRMLPVLIKLQHCKKLNLKNNLLTTLKGFPALELEELNLQGNKIDQSEIELLKEKYSDTNIIF